MNYTTVLCGHLPDTKSSRLHPIQNIILKSTTDWTRAEFYYNENVIYTIGNMPSHKYNISLQTDGYYNLNLTVNDKIIMTEKQLFFVEIKIQTTSSDFNINNFVELYDTTIYDG